MFRTAVWLFQLPYHFDRTGVRVIAMCPGVTDTILISEAPRRLLREEWGEEFRKNADEMLQQKWVLVINEWSLLHTFYNLAVYNKALLVLKGGTLCITCCTCDFYLLGYLRTVFQLGTIGRMSCKCEEMWVVNCAELDVHHIILCTILSFAISPVRSHLKSQ